MKERAWWLITWLIINIILTPILMVATASSGILIMWGTWLLIMISIYTKKSRIEKRSRKRTEEFWKKQEAERPAKEAEIKRRIENDLFTYESFKKYMNKRGFDVEGNIDIFWDEIQRIKVETHKSKEQLAEDGIYTVRQILGKYNWHFDFYDFYGDGFTYNKKEIINADYETEIVDDYHNVIAYAWYIPGRDFNIKTNNKDYIYRIERKKKYVYCANSINGHIIVNKDKIEELSEGDYKRKLNDAAYIYEYKIYRWKSGITEKINNASLTESEKRFIALAKKEKQKKRNKANSSVTRTLVDKYKYYPINLEGCCCFDGNDSDDTYFLLNKNPIIIV